MRFSISFVLTLAAVAGLASPALAAPPKLKGVYTVAGTQMCQAPVGLSGGDIEHQMGTITFTPTATNTAMKMVVMDQWGPAVTNTGSIAANPVTVNGSITVAGTANPYAVTIKMTVGNATMTTTGYAQLDLAGAGDGIARRAVILSSSSNGDLPGTNCTTEMVLFRQ